jgi:hypothetical protein
MVISSANSFLNYTPFNLSAAYNISTGNQQKKKPTSHKDQWA